jgi:hypothetical protein
MKMGNNHFNNDDLLTIKRHLKTKNSTKMDAVMVRYQYMKSLR